jgi:hypothetical protein
MNKTWITPKGTLIEDLGDGTFKDLSLDEIFELAEGETISGLGWKMANREEWAEQQNREMNDEIAKRQRAGDYGAGVFGRERGKPGTLNGAADFADVITESVVSPVGSLVADLVPEDGISKMSKEDLYKLALAIDAGTALAPPLKAGLAAAGLAAKAGPFATKLAQKIGRAPLMGKTRLGKTTEGGRNPDAIKIVEENRLAINNLNVEKELLLRENAEAMKGVALNRRNLYKPSKARQPGLRNAKPDDYGGGFQGIEMLSPSDVIASNNRRMAEIEAEILDRSMTIKQLRRGMSMEPLVEGAKSLESGGRRLGAGLGVGAARIFGDTHSSDRDGFSPFYEED